MTPRTFESALAIVGLTQSSAARWLGVGPRQVRRWVRGDAPIPLSVSLLLHLMIDRGLSQADVDAACSSSRARLTPAR